MRHAPIAAVLLRHDYYADGRCPDFAIEPSAETERLLRNHRCQWGGSTDGLRILTPLAETGQPFLPLPADAVLSFHLTLRNREFSLFTDLSGLAGSRATPRFTDAGALPGPVVELQLASAAPEQPRRPPGVFADVEIHLDRLPTDPSAPPPLQTFHVSFQAKRARWAYYCVTDLPANSNELRIVDGAPGGADEVLLFGAANRTKLDEQPDPADPIAVQLLSRYPAMRCIRLLSDQTVACRQKPRKYLELRLGDERLAGPLPNPSLRDAAREDLLFRIVKYRTQPFPNP